MNIRFTKIAEEDLFSIKEGICEVSKDDKIAEKIIKEIIESLERLKDFPDSGARYEDDDGNFLYRYVKAGNYYSFYKCDNKHIDVYRVLFAKRDFKMILK